LKSLVHAGGVEEGDFAWFTVAIGCCQRLSAEFACLLRGDGELARGAIQLWATNNEQRFAIRTFGLTKREVVDFEGLHLIRLPLTE